MPVESVAAYINNTLTLVIFILVSTILFLLTLVTSAGIRKRVMGRNSRTPHRQTDAKNGGKSFTGADPLKKTNIATTAMSFVLVLLSLLLILASYYFSLNMSIGTTIYVISFILLAMIVVLVYMFKSGVFKR